MNGMTRYYLSRALISAALGGLFALTGARWWVAALVSAITFASFLWAPHGGRYVVKPEEGATALRRDEYTQAITDKAARNGFVVAMLALGGIAIYFGTIAPSDVPVRVLSLLLALGALTYFASDLWLRRA